MKKLRKIMLSVGCFIGLLLFGFIAVKLKVNNIQVTAADTNTVYTPQQYTKSDQLLSENGVELQKDIVTFANEVKAAYSGTLVPEITQVIPRQYMESETENAVYQYNGVEYGFYMVKQGEYFDVLLIDFQYNFFDGTSPNNEYVLRIKPLLQQSFKREYTELDGYTYRKDSGSTRFKYYIANPSFLTTVENAHQLNYGNYGYSKAEDAGVFIYQSRVNYGKVGYKTESDLFQLRASFTAEKMLDIAAGMLQIEDIKDCIQHQADIFLEGRETIITVNSDNSIFTEQSRTDQLNDPSVPSFSRMAGVTPKETDEVILSADENSYAEFVVLLNDTNEPCRLTQYCDFQIVRRTGDWSSMQYVTSDGERETLSTKRQRFLFEKNYQMDGDLMPYLILDSGVQTYEFTPTVSGYYRINSNHSDVRVGINGVNSKKMQLGQYFQKGTTYEIGLYVVDTPAMGTANIQVRTFENLGYVINAKDDYVLSFTPTQNGIYAVEGKHYNAEQYCNVRVYVDLFGNKEQVGDNVGDSVIISMQAGTEYFLVFQNDTEERIVIHPTCEIAALQDINNFNAKSVEWKANEVYWYRFNSDLESLQYDFVFSGADNLNAIGMRLLTADGQEITFNKTTGSNYIRYRTSAALPVNTYYVRICPAEDVDVMFGINRHVESFYWKIDGERYVQGTGIRRGEEHSIRLYNTLGDEIILNSLTVNLTYSNFVNIDLANNIFLILENAPMYSDDLELITYCEFYANDDQNIDITFFVIFQDEEVSLDWVGITDSYNAPRLYISSTFYQGESAKLYCNYTLDEDNNLREGILTMTGEGYFDLSQLNNNLNAYNLITNFTVNSILITNNNYGVYAYNNALPGNVNKVNHTSISSIPYITLRFADGKGTGGEPYVITCYRHFNNIRYVDDENTYFSLNNEIYLQENFEMFPTFYGTLKGYGCTIYNLDLEIPTNNATDMAYGLFAKNYGTIRDVNVCNVNMSRTGGANVYCNMIGGIVGLNMPEGQILSCSTYNITLSFETAYREQVGGIAGQNQGLIKYCEVNSGTFSTCCYTGGIVGSNRGTLEYCNVTGTINVKWVQESKAFGGIAGYNIGTVKGCNFTGDIYFYSPSNSTKILPCIGYIIGWNDGGSQTDNSMEGSSYDTEYYYFWPIYNQSDRMFKVDEGRVGYQT